MTDTSRFIWDSGDLVLLRRELPDADREYVRDPIGQFATVPGSREERLAAVRAGLAQAEAAHPRTEPEGAGDGRMNEAEVNDFAKEWAEGGTWNDYQHAGKAAINGTPRDGYVCYDCSGNDGERYDKAQDVMDHIESSPPLNKPLYRGLMEGGGDYKVGDTFSEALSSWTGDKDLAQQFAEGHYKAPWEKVDKPTVIGLAEGSGMKGINVSDRLPKSSSDRLRTADEYLTSGQYRVSKVEEKGGLRHVSVERVGRAQKKDIVDGVPVAELLDYNMRHVTKGPTGGQFAPAGGSGSGGKGKRGKSKSPREREEERKAKKAQGNSGKKPKGPPKSKEEREKEREARLAERQAAWEAREKKRAEKGEEREAKQEAKGKEKEQGKREKEQGKQEKGREKEAKAEAKQAEKEAKGKKGKAAGKKAKPKGPAFESHYSKPKEQKHTSSTSKGGGGGAGGVSSKVAGGGEKFTSTTSRGGAGESQFKVRTEKGPIDPKLKQEAKEREEKEKKKRKKTRDSLADETCHQPGGQSIGGQFMACGPGGEGGEVGGKASAGAAEKNTADLLQPTGESVDDIIDKVPGGREFVDGAKAKLEDSVDSRAPVSEGGFKDENGNWTPERQAEHDKIVRDTFSPEKVAAATPAPGEQPTLDILGGRGGSGKSFFTGKDGTVDESKAIVLNNDDVKAALSNYEGWNAANVHEESSEVGRTMERMAKDMGLNVVIDGTMKSEGGAHERIDEFKAAGYKVNGHYMYTSPEKSAERALKRAVDGEKRFNEGKQDVGGRFVDPAYSHGSRSNEKTFDAVKHKLDNWQVYDNNVDGRKPVFHSRKGG